MSSTVDDPLRLRAALGRKWWGVPQRYGPTGWVLRTREEPWGSVIVTSAPWDGVEWVHASIAFDHGLPLYEDLQRLHRAVFGEGWAYQVFAPPSSHVNIHPNALHLWGRADGKAALPDFGAEGTI